MVGRKPSGDRVGGADQKQRHRRRSLNRERANNTDAVIAGRQHHNGITGLPNGFARGSAGRLHGAGGQHQTGDAGDLGGQDEAKHRTFQRPGEQQCHERQAQTTDTAIRWGYC